MMTHLNIPVQKLMLKTIGKKHNSIVIIKSESKIMNNSSGRMATRYSTLLSSSSSMILAVLLLLAAISVEGFQQPQQQRRTVPVPVVGVVPTSSSVPTFLSRQKKSVFSTTASSATTAVSDDNDADRVLDKEAIVKYVAAVAVQMVLFKGFFTGIDLALSAFGIQQTQIPFAVNFVTFYVLALKSRIFNPMSNQRPTNIDTKEIEDKDKDEVSVPARKMPEWTPPGIVFPIVWLLIIGPLRAASTALLVSSGNVAYGSMTILALMLHLSIGDTWNTINNVERRYGTSVVGVLCVWLSAAFAAYSYGLVDTVPLAGKLLSLPLIWLTIASSLIVRTWQINPNPINGNKESLLPTKPSSQDGTITKLVWFEKEE